MFTAAIIGPAVSVERIESVIEDFPSPMRFTSFVYQTPAETTGIIQSHYEAYDYFLFSGPIPYELALRTGKDPSKFFPIVLLETGFYKALLNVTNQIGKPVERLGIDIVNTTDLVSASLDQLKVPVEEVYVETFDPAIDCSTLYEYHMTLWREDKIDAVLTCYPDVMDQLNRQGVPCDLISTTKLATRHALETIKNHAEITVLKRSQIGVCMLMIENLLFEQNSQMSYDVQLINLKLHEELLLLSREMNGSFISHREGQYMIFSSRGEIVDTFTVLQETISRLERTWSRKITSGIGFGDSALKAEMHARKALQMTRGETGNIVLIDHKGDPIDLPKNHYDGFSVYREEQLLELLRSHKINVQLFDRLREVIRRKRWPDFTAKDLALELNMSDRNIQRALLALTNAGVAEQIGEEKAVSQGRPSKLYQLKEKYR